MINVKKLLAGVMTAAMVVTGSGLSTIGTLPVFAAGNVKIAKANYYEPVVKSGTTTLEYGEDGYETSGQFGNTITLSASTTTTSKKAVSGQTVYDWAVYTDEEAEDAAKDSLGNAITGKSGSISFDLDDVVPGNAYYVFLSVAQNYTLDGEAFVETVLYNEMIVVNVNKKKIASSDVTGPELNTVIKPYGTGDGYGTDATGDYVTLGYVADSLIASDSYSSDLGKGWKIDTATTSEDTKFYVGEATNVAFKFCVDSDSEYYTVSDAANWNTGYSLAATAAVTATASKQYVESVELDCDESGLYYNPSLDATALKALNSAEVNVDFEVYKENKNDATTVEPAFKSSDESALAYSFDPKTNILSVNATGIPENESGYVEITAYDPEGTGDKDTIGFIIAPAIDMSKLDFATVDPTFAYKAGATVKDILDVDSLNAEESNLPDAEQTGKWYYVYKYDKGNEREVSGETSINIGDRYNFYGHYDGDGTIVKLKNGAYVLSDDENAGVKLLNQVTVVAPEITKEYVEEAIAAIKIDDVALAGGTFGYGLDLGDEPERDGKDGGKYIATEYAGITLSLVNKNTNKVVKRGDEEIPDIGEHTSDYVIRVAASSSDYTVPADVAGDYPISFTITKATLATKAGASEDDAVAYDSYIYAESSTTLYAICEPSYEEATEDYTFAYQWYNNGKAVDTGDYETISDGNGLESYLSNEDGFSGAWYCKFTATAVINKNGVLEETVANSPVVTIGEQKISVLDMDYNNAEIAYGSPITLGSTSCVETIERNFAVKATDYTIGTTTLTVKDSNGNKVDAQSFDGAKNYKTIAYETSASLDAGSYSLWISTSAATTGNTGATSASYNAEIATFTVTPLNPSDWMDNAANYAERDSKNAIAYGELPNDVLNYEFAYAGSGYTNAETERINDLINANFTIAVQTNDNTISDVGTKDIHLVATPVATGFSSNISRYAKDTYTTDEAKTLTVNKKQVNLYADKDSYTWTLGSESPLTASYKDDEFVGEDTAEALGFGYTYEILKNGTVVKDAQIDIGEYTVQFKATGADNSNYEVVNPDAVALKVVSSDPSQQIADEFIAKVNAADLTNADTVAALLAEYDGLSSDVQKLVADAKAKLDAAQAEIQKKADEEAAANVITLLSALTENSTKEEAQAALDAYNALTTGAKAIVDANDAAKAGLAIAEAKTATQIASNVTFKALKIKRGKAKKIAIKKQTGGGKITYVNKSAKKVKKVIKVTKAGKIKVTKKAKKGKKYTIKVKATIAAKGNYKKTTVTRTFKVKVK